ncbi:hypothetical protein AB205_0148850 [Aquarana catesbeiana]|uniref:Uncharacterized protein n=1 Tax=Aquarana catesbeiana TaxID=8400 RepID=A0A2G9RY08_AQUCT|nr:hypothetical protein AB205_0148850 [Aquarana catesbeiana]
MKTNKKTLDGIEYQLDYKGKDFEQWSRVFRNGKCLHCLAGASSTCIGDISCFYMCSRIRETT